MGVGGGILIKTTNYKANWINFQQNLNCFGENELHELENIMTIIIIQILLHECVQLKGRNCLIGREREREKKNLYYHFN